MFTFLLARVGTMRIFSSHVKIRASSHLPRAAETQSTAASSSNLCILKHSILNLVCVNPCCSSRVTPALWWLDITTWRHRGGSPEQDLSSGFRISLNMIWVIILCVIFTKNIFYFSAVKVRCVGITKLCWLWVLENWQICPNKKEKLNKKPTNC